MKYLIIILMIIAITPVKAGKIIRAEAPEDIYFINSVNISKNNIEGIMAILGETHISAGSHTNRSICYYNKNEMLDIVVSSLGYGLEVVKLQQSKNDLSKCLKVDYEFFNGFGIQLDLTKDQVLNMFGSPTRGNEERVNYEYAIEKGVTDDSKLYLDTNVNFSFEDEKLVKYWFFTTETN